MPLRFSGHTRSGFRRRRGRVNPPVPQVNPPPPSVLPPHRPRSWRPTVEVSQSRRRHRPSPRRRRRRVYAAVVAGPVAKVSGPLASAVAAVAATGATGAGRAFRSSKRGSAHDADRHGVQPRRRHRRMVRQRRVLRPRRGNLVRLILAFIINPQGC